MKVLNPEVTPSYLVKVLACKMKPINDRATITHRTHGLEIKVHERRKGDFLYIKVLIEGRSESFTCKFLRVTTVIAVHYSCWQYLRNDLDSIIDLLRCLRVRHAVAGCGLLNVFL
jgi:hypothetical protein